MTATNPTETEPARNEELRVLILEDMPVDAALINHELHLGGLAFCSKRVETSEQFLHEIEHHHPDIILSDHGLPHFDGFAALAIAQDKCPDVPFIFVTGSLGEEKAVETLRSGATDYVLKNRLATNLVPAVRQALREAEERRKRRAAEQALHESEERFRRLVEGVKDYAIFMLDRDGSVSSWNAGAEGIQGYRANDIIGRKFSAFYTPEDIQRGQPEQDLDTADHEGRCEVEGWRRRKNGQPFWASVVITALRDDKGRLRGFADVTRDITERRRVQQALEASEARKGAILETALDAIISIDHAGRVQEWNPAAEQMFGRLRTDAVGREMAELIIPSRMREQHRQGLARLAAGREARLLGRRLEMTALRANGKEFPAELTITRVVGDGPPTFTGFIRDITERKQAESALRESEARKGAILDAAFDAIITIDEQARVREWNAAAERILGCRREAALGRRMEELVIAPGLRERYEDKLVDYLITGVGSLLGRPIELTAQRADGAQFPAELTITHVPLDGQTLYTCFIRDISARKQAEEEIRQSEERHRLLVESVEDYAIYMLDPEGRVATWNTGAQRIEGYEAHEIIGQHFSRLYAPEDIERRKPEQALKAALEQGHYQEEGIRVRKDGSRYWANVTLTALRDEEGKLRGFSKIHRDMTARKRAEEDLRQSEERYRMLVDSVEDYAIYMLDPEGRAATWNAGAERIEGYAIGEILGQPVSRFFPPEEIERGRPDLLLKTAAAQDRCQDEGWRLRKDGTRYWASVVYTALRDDQGKLCGYSAISRDMTARKKADEEIQRLNAELEQRVVDRTAQLQAAYQEMESFSYSISHDLRAPLRHIQGFVDMLEDATAGKLDEESRNLLATISGSAVQMGRLIDALLEFSRMGRVDVSKEQVNLAQLVQSVRNDLQLDLQGRKVEWQMGELANVWADPALLRQVIYNLASNALKYSRKRERALIEMGTTETGQEIIFHIRDNGAGFDMTYAAKLFGVFQRLHRAADFEGTGIGLANVKRIIQRHGGRVWAEGTVDGGATFFFSLPKFNQSSP